jgi:hypothetical protein
VQLLFTIKNNIYFISVLIARPVHIALDRNSEQRITARLTLNRDPAYTTVFTGVIVIISSFCLVALGGPAAALFWLFEACSLEALLRGFQPQTPPHAACFPLSTF